MEVFENKPLAEFTWYKIGGPADLLYLPESIEDLINAQREIHQRGLDLTVISGATNILVSDVGIRGATICTQKMTDLSHHVDGERVFITAMAGVPKAQLTKIFLKYKLAPALFLSGIPGNVDGGVFMNAGVSEEVHPREFDQIVDWIEVVRPDGELVKLTSEEIKWSYRKSEGWQPGVIARAGLVWGNQPDKGIIGEVRAATRSRLARQPLEYPSCGSVFVNPVGDKSGRLIEAAGLKGLRQGDAQISEKHANFIINLGQARATDVKGLIDTARATVEEKFGITLHHEVRFIGQW